MSGVSVDHEPRVGDRCGEIRVRGAQQVVVSTADNQGRSADGSSSQRRGRFVEADEAVLPNLRWDRTAVADPVIDVVSWYRMVEREPGEGLTDLLGADGVAESFDVVSERWPALKSDR